MWKWRLFFLQGLDFTLDLRHRLLMNDTGHWLLHNCDNDNAGEKLQQHADVAMSLRAVPAKFFYLSRLCCRFLGRLHVQGTKKKARQKKTPILRLSHLQTTQLHHSHPLWDVHPKVLDKFFLCPWKFGFFHKCVIQAHFSRAIHIKKLSEKCSALLSKWKCIAVIAALFFQYNPSIFAYQFIFSLFVFSTHLYLTFPSEGVTCELPPTTIHLNLPMGA